VTATTLLLHCAETPVGVFFPAGLSLLFFFFLLLVCLSQFPSRYPLFLCFSVSIISLSTQSVSLSRFPPFFLSFSSSSRVLALGVFIGQKGAGASLLPPYSSAWGAGLCCPTTAPGLLANGRGWQSAAPSVSHHESAWGVRFWQGTRCARFNEERRRK